MDQRSREQDYQHAFMDFSGRRGKRLHLRIQDRPERSNDLSRHIEGRTGTQDTDTAPEQVSGLNTEPHPRYDEQLGIKVSREMTRDSGAGIEKPGQIAPSPERVGLEFTKCPVCGSPHLAFQEACYKCLECSWSTCVIG